ncbi:hypothetical protein DFH07DRAFT_948768 [Mycena maculata]|uniref:Cytochrome P450 n=1 Tax=Mycena maculata TaxID=230809 RepID=A0AAD7KEY1_9AGAR|nr:hypothetical protein DFH07DRAFT_948768 [Mycena maculata]
MKLPILTVVLNILPSYLTYRFLQQRKHNPKRLPPPPGPRQKYLIGNLRDLPSPGREWRAIVFLRVLGSPILCINSLQAASDLLDRKGVVFSDRPKLPLLKDLTGWRWNLVVMSYHEGFTAHRKVVQQHLQPSIVAEKYRSVMLAPARVLLSSLRSHDGGAIDAPLLKRMAGAIIMKVTYGHQISDGPDEFLDLAEEVRTRAVKTPAGAAIVGTFPIRE